MSKRRALGVVIGPRKMGAAAAAATFTLVVAAGYWLWGTPAILVGIGLLQLGTVLAVAQSMVTQHRQRNAARARHRELDGRLTLLGERVEAFERSWSSKVAELATTADMTSAGERVDALERSWSSIAADLATSKDMSAHAEAISRSVGSELEQSAHAMEQRLAQWRSEDRDEAEKQAQRGKREHYHEYRQVESLAALYYGLRPRQALPPTRSWTASPDFLHFLYELVRSESPERIIECGSGLSTVVMAYALEQNGSGKVLALEHLEEYRAKTEGLLRGHRVEDFAHVLLAPLEQHEIAYEQHQWYALDGVGDGPWDLLVVDGPPGATQEQARYPALPLLRAALSERASVVLDDYDRADERRVAKRWVQEVPEFGLTAVRHEKGTAVLRRQPQVNADLEAT